MQLLEDENTAVIRAEISTNSFGEFLFVTTQQEQNETAECLTFWGMGYHEARERWIAHEWYWYRGSDYPSSLRQELTLEEVKELIQSRLADIEPELNRTTQTGRGRLYELLADLTDEDGALSELEDLGDFPDDWDG